MRTLAKSLYALGSLILAVCVTLACLFLTLLPARVSAAVKAAGTWSAAALASPSPPAALLAGLLACVAEADLALGGASDSRLAKAVTAAMSRAGALCGRVGAPALAALCSRASALDGALMGGRVGPVAAAGAAGAAHALAELASSYRYVKAARSGARRAARKAAAGGAGREGGSAREGTAEAPPPEAPRKLD